MIKIFLYTTYNTKNIYKSLILKKLFFDHADVKDVIVIPVLDEEAGEFPRAYVVKQNDPKSMEVTAEEIVEV
jgi:acyl-CoA synthetase (AMP-forming)/AMP-acid ligase II